MDSSGDDISPPYYFFVLPAFFIYAWLLFLPPLLFIVWLCLICPVLACMSCFCRPRLKWIYKYVDKIVRRVFRFVESREVKDNDGVKVPRFVMFGYLAPPMFTFYLFFLCLVTICYTLAGFFNSFLIDITDICSPYDEYSCFTSEGERVSKPVERPTDSSELTCFNDTEFNCFMFVYDTEGGVTHAAALLTLSWLIIFVMIWVILKCSGGQGSGCHVPCCCCPRGRWWCSCGCRCILTVLLQGFLLIVPQCFILSPFFDEYIALLFKNYLNLDTTGAFVTSDSLKLLHVATMITFGVFVPWCWFKKVPSPSEAGADSARTEAETGDTARRDDQQSQAEAGQRQENGLRHEDAEKRKTDEEHMPTQVRIGKTKSVSGSIDLEMYPV